MNLALYSWNGNLINDWLWNGTGLGEWSSEFPVGERGKLAATAIYSPIAYSFPKLSTVQFDGHYISVAFHPKSTVAGHTLAFMREELKQWLQMGKDFAPHQLIAQDLENSNKQWYVNAIPVDFVQTTIAEFVVVFALVDPIWRSVVLGTSGNISVVASPTNTTLTVGGNVPAPLKISITPTSARAGGFLYKRYVLLYNPTTRPFPYIVSPIETTNGGLDTASLILAGKMLASGNDLRLIIDGNDSNRWFGVGAHAINTATTYVWGNIPHSKGQIGTLLTSLPNSGTAVDVTFVQNPANLAVLKALAQAPNKAFLIDSEVFTYTKANIDLANYKIKSCTRAAKTTAFAAHTANASIFWIEHDVWLAYGQAAATAPSIDDTQKPVLDLDASTNGSWTWANFFDTTSSRPGEWKPTVVNSITNKLTSKMLTNYYTGNQLALADPATELGLQMQTVIVNGVQKAETALLRWYFYHPAGMTNLSMSGSKYLFNLALWPAVAGAFKSNDFVNFLQVWNEAAPGVANTWTAFAHASVALGATYYYIGLELQGSIAAKLNNVAAIQGDTVTAVLTANRPTPTLLAEVGSYHIQATIRNNTSGEEMYVNAVIKANQVLTIDCGAKTCTLDDGTNLFNAISLSSNRINANWLDIGQDANSKFVGTAAMIYTEPGVVAETLNYSWNDSSE